MYPYIIRRRQRALAAQNKKNLRAGVEKTTDPEVLHSLTIECSKSVALYCFGVKEYFTKFPVFCAGQETFRRDNPDSDKPLTTGMYFPFPLHGCAHSREKRIHRSRSARARFGDRYRRNEALLLRRSRSGDIRQLQSQPWRCALPRSEQKQHRNDKDRRNPLAQMVNLGFFAGKAISDAAHIDCENFCDISRNRSGAAVTDFFKNSDMLIDFAGGLFVGFL